MSSAERLRAVGQDERPAPRSVTEAAEHGTHLEELRAIRTRLARVIDDPKTSARDLAALTRRQLEVSKEIRAMELKELEESRLSRAEDAWDPAAI